MEHEKSGPKTGPFYTSGVYVRGPARPSGSGFKETVFELPDERRARMTAESLNEIFAFSSGVELPEDLGTTTRQIKFAPACAIFVWCNERTDYPEKLARHLGRTDLAVRPLSWLRPFNAHGRRYHSVVVDHAARLGSEGFAALEYLRDRGVPVTLQPKSA